MPPAGHCGLVATTGTSRVGRRSRRPRGAAAPGLRPIPEEADLAHPGGSDQVVPVDEFGVGVAGGLGPRSSGQGRGQRSAVAHQAFREDPTVGAGAIDGIVDAENPGHASNTSTKYRTTEHGLRRIAGVVISLTAMTTGIAPAFADPKPDPVCRRPSSLCPSPLRSNRPLRRRQPQASAPGAGHRRTARWPGRAAGARRSSAPAQGSRGAGGHAGPVTQAPAPRTQAPAIVQAPPQTQAPVTQDPPVTQSAPAKPPTVAPTTAASAPATSAEPPAPATTRRSVAPSAPSTPAEPEPNKPDTSTTSATSAAPAPVPPSTGSTAPSPALVGPPSAEPGATATATATATAEAAARRRHPRPHRLVPSVLRVSTGRRRRVSRRPRGKSRHSRPRR